MNDKKIALVTGANRGIGFEICRQLADKEFEVLLTARDQTEGEKALNELMKKSKSIRFHVLDVSDSNSRENISEFVEKEYGRLDVLINNAGILIDSGTSAANIPLQTIRDTFEINFLGPLALCQLFLPLMQHNDYGRIVNVSSGMGAMNEMGAGNTAYRISKTTLNALTIILSKENNSPNILINAMCPGWVRTRMGGNGAPRSVVDGAKTAVWLSMLPKNGPTGKFFRDNREIKW